MHKFAMASLPTVDSSEASAFEIRNELADFLGMAGAVYGSHHLPDGCVRKRNLSLRSGFVDFLIAGGDGVLEDTRFGVWVWLGAARGVAYRVDKENQNLRSKSEEACKGFGSGINHWPG